MIEPDMQEIIQAQRDADHKAWMEWLTKKHALPEKFIFFGLIRIRGPPPHHQIKTTRLNGAPMKGDDTFVDGGWIWYEDQCQVCPYKRVYRERGYYDSGLF